MKVAYEWLKDFVAVQSAAAELSARLSLAGVAIDSIEDSAAGPVLGAEITANRPDCLGHYGIAREIAAIYRLPLNPLNPKPRESAATAADAARVEIESPELCGRYTARVIRNVKIQPSPDWLRKRLEAIGQNSINNVVDVTNYVMFELGQPLHAFDLDKLAERRIIVRRARPGEKIRTLDGADRTLTKEICVIADASRPIAVAGVIGGANTEIGTGTRNILIESAWFDPASIRRASKSLGVRTEASYRFERGADPEMAEVASRRAAELILQVAGGELLAGSVDVYPARQAPQEIALARPTLLRVMGADVPGSDIEQILTALGFEPLRADAGGASGSPDAAWNCRRPSWRQDVTREIDLIEEIARLYGYDKFPPRLPAAKAPARPLPRANAENRLRERLIALGYHEIVEIPIVDAQRDALFRPQKLAPAAIANPLAENASVMRSSGIVSLIGALEWNLNRGQRNLRLFEIGKFYELREGEPLETPIVTLGASGLAREKNIHEPEREFAFADLKGDLDRIGELAGGFEWESAGPEWLAQNRAAGIRLASAGRSELIGPAGQLARPIADRLKLRQDIFLAQLNLVPLLAQIEASQASSKFAPLPRFHAVERDFSIVLAEGTAFSRVAQAIRSLGIPELQRVEAADLFRGGQLPPGKFSLMVRVVFQSPQATLTDSHVADFSSRIIAVLEHRLGASLRAG